MAGTAPTAEIESEERLRAGWYGLLSRVLAAPPDQEALNHLATLQGDESEFGMALGGLAAAARAARPETVRQEHFDLFVGISGGELTPYGSYYLTGFLHEKPLARLRSDMSKLGLARADGVIESEDHIASLCEMMAGLITGAYGAPADLNSQRNFFRDHIGCWAPRFFEDLQAASNASFYMPVGAIGSQFMAIEAQAFEMAA